MVDEDGVAFASPLDGAPPPPHARERRRDPGGARRRRRDGARRVRSDRAGRGAGGAYSSARWSARCAGRERCARARGAPTRRCSASCRAAPTPALRRAQRARDSPALGFDGYRARRARARRGARAARRSSSRACTPSCPTGAPRYLMGLGRPEDLVAGDRAGRRPLRLRAADAPRAPRRALHERGRPRASATRASRDDADAARPRAATAPPAREHSRALPAPPVRRWTTRSARASPRSTTCASTCACSSARARAIARGASPRCARRWPRPPARAWSSNQRARRPRAGLGEFRSSGRLHPRRWPPEGKGGVWPRDPMAPRIAPGLRPARSPRRRCSCSSRPPPPSCSRAGSASALGLVGAAVVAAAGGLRAPAAPSWRARAGVQIGRLLDALHAKASSGALDPALGSAARAARRAAPRRDRAAGRPSAARRARLQGSLTSLPEAHQSRRVAR